ncbi:MAG: respiratory nitrate reductase subunit gamma [Chloroflexota bacterium]
MDTSTALWTLLSYIIIGLAYFAGITFVLGLIWRLWGYVRTPMPWPEVTTPAPHTEGGAIGRVIGDVLLFPNLFKADKFLWAGAWVFHIALAAVLFRHLRYFTYPVPSLVLYMETVALYFGYLFGLATLYLFWRRLALPRTLYLSGLPDYFALGLLGAITGTGLMVSYWAHAYLVDVKAFMLGLLTLHPVAPPLHPLFLLHFLLVLLLLIYFPFSKLLHAGGVFFSPSRNQPYEIQKRGKIYVNRGKYPIQY